MTRTFPSNAIIGAAGENLVLSHLLRLNYVAGLAPYNTKDYDLIILSSDETVAKSIQVKSALFAEEARTTDLKWILKDKHENKINNLIFCFVVMSMKSSLSQIYIMDSDLVSYVVKMSHQIYLKLPGMQGQLHSTENKMRIMSSDYLNSVTNKKNREQLREYLNPEEIDFLNKHSQGWMDKYLDNWDIIDE